jgi:hypothetical protein
LHDDSIGFQGQKYEKIIDSIRPVADNPQPPERTGKPKIYLSPNGILPKFATLIGKIEHYGILRQQ